MPSADNQPRKVEAFKVKGPSRYDEPNTEIRITKEGRARSLSFPASSETPVERWYGIEVLSHEPDAVRLDRMKRGAVPLLFNHNLDDPVGVIHEGRVDGGRLRVQADLFDTNRASEVLQMIEGGLRNVSVGYRIGVIEERKDEGRFVVTEWEPYEVSIVSVPADPTVGMGRTTELEYEVRMIRSSEPGTHATMGGRTMPEKEKGNGAAATAEPEQKVEVENSAGPSALNIEKERKRAIENLCKANRIDDRTRDLWVTSGASVAQVSDDLLQILEERGKSNPQSMSVLGLTPKETQSFSLCRMIEATANQNWSKAAFEAECSRAIAQKLGRSPDPRKFLVPYEVQERANATPMEMLAYALAKRDMTVGVGAQGGFLVQTSNVGFIELLRNRSVMFNMGAMRLSGLRDSVTIPKQTVAATHTWLATEATAITEANQTFVQVAMSPKNVGGYTELSRQLLLQSNPSIESLVTLDLAITVALAIDLAGLNGSGASGQPTGILNTAGIGSVTGTALDYADIIEFQTDVFAGNALTGQSGYVTTGTVAGLLKQRVKFTSTASPIWDGRLEEASVDGYRGMASNQMPTATMLFGDFGTVIVGEWGVLEVEVNPFANFQAGIIGVRAIASIDVAVRYPTAFSAASSIT